MRSFGVLSAITLLGMLWNFELRADFIGLPENQVPTELIGTWKVVGYSKSGFPVKDADDTLPQWFLGKTFVFSPSNAKVDVDNKCPLGISFDKGNGDDSPSSDNFLRTEMRVEYKNLFSSCKSRAGNLLNENSIRSMKAFYVVNTCKQVAYAPRKSGHMLHGYMVIDEETLVGIGEEEYYCMKRVIPAVSLAGTPSNPSAVASLNVTVGGNNVVSYVSILKPGNTCTESNWCSPMTDRTFL